VFDEAIPDVWVNLKGSGWKEAGVETGEMVPRCHVCRKPVVSRRMFTDYGLCRILKKALYFGR